MKHPIAQNTFEETDGWAPVRPEWLSDEQAHSGRYSCRMGTNSEFGVTFYQPWAAIDSPRKVRIQAWARLPHGRLKAAVVMQITRHDSLVYWNSMAIHAVVKRYNQWVPVHKLFVLPADLEPTDQVKIYLWQFSEHKDVMYLDDLIVDKVS